MKTLKLALRAAVLAAILSWTASPASAWVQGCYASCPTSGNHFISGPMSQSDCCGVVPTWIFLCPEGGQAYGYGYEDWLGPNFCS